MSYLRFDKTLMINLQESLPREILRTNRSGAYHCTTIVDCNTRKYHGLLVIPVPNLDDENHVLLSSLDETVIQHGAEFNLGLHKYQGIILARTDISISVSLIASISRQLLTVWEALFSAKRKFLYIMRTGY